VDLRLTALIANAHLLLRRETEHRYPHLIDERLAMGKFRLPMPIELAGLTSRMTRADNQEKDIAALGKRYDKVQDDIDGAIEAHNVHVDDLEHYRDAWTRKVDSMLARPNGGDPLDGGAKTGQSGQPGAGQEQVVKTETVTVTADEVAPIESVLPEVSPLDASAPERLTVNGVSTGS